MTYRYLLWVFAFSLAAKKPVGLEWRDYCCSYAAAIQLLYGLDSFRAFIVDNKTLIDSKAPDTHIAAVAGIFSRIRRAEEGGEAMVPYKDLERFYKKFGLTGSFTDAFLDVLLPLIEMVDQDLRKYLQELWPEFRRLCVIEFNYENAAPEYRTLSPVSGGEIAGEVEYNALHTIVFPRYQAVYGGVEGARDPLAFSISPYDQLHSVVQVIPGGTYELVGAFRVTSGHVAAIRSEGVWYFCDGKTVREVSIDELQADYQNLSWRFYAYEPLADTLQNFGVALTQLFDLLP